MYAGPIITTFCKVGLKMLTDTFGWSPSYGSGNHIVDNHYKKILGLWFGISKFRNTADPKYFQKFHNILNELKDYSNEYVVGIELASEDGDYPYIMHMQELHSNFSLGLSDLIKDAKQGYYDREKLRHFLEEYWIDQIIMSEMEN